LIPLINNIYNATSENYNKYLELGMFGVPILTIDIYPYHSVIQNEKNGFLMRDKAELVGRLEYLNNNRGLLKAVGEYAKKDVVQNFNYSEETVDVLSNIYSFNPKEEVVHGDGE